ncbi:tagaturonate epimerase family protein [Zunongwangia sp. H14]|uniref:tagaturonate epimerase family protein n=1 Tax=Zunongwangia sp. H14 TaxID=3240792 RepID=UPI003566D51B
MARLGKYSFGTGDRFGKEGKAQLRAVLKMQEKGINVIPVWNKSNREHLTVGTKAPEVRKEADAAVKALEYKGDYLVDADHIGLKTVEPYLPVSDFFTIDVADFIGKKASEKEEQQFLQFFEKYLGDFKIPGIEHKIEISKMQLQEMLDNFLLAMQKAGEVYRLIASEKTEEFSTEVSIDEVENPQTPVELFFILAALAFYEVPVNTIAPKFTGEFNKGVDYRGDLQQFEKEFEEDLLVLKYAVKEFGLPQNLKLSVHSGSDKFSIYPVMQKLIKKHDAGLHLKTAGTTWLEELIGLAESEGDAFKFAKAIYAEALERYDELTRDYAEVLSIDKGNLPSADGFSSGKEFADALRHDQKSDSYNPNFRQLLHCAYKLAAEKDNFQGLLDKHRTKIEENVTYNLYERHLKNIFPS